MKCWQISFAALVALSGFAGTSGPAPGLLLAQQPGVSVTGAETIKRSAELLRMEIEISAQGKTLPEALKKLAARREAASAQMVKLSSDPATTKFGEPKLSAATSARQRQIEMMVRQRMRQGGKKKKSPTEKLVTVSCALSAQWKLQAKTAEELLVEARGIEEKVRAADLAGLKSAEKTAEEEELAEEMEDQMGMYQDESEAKPGEPVFVYVSKISAEDRAKALASAFAKARTQAAELSKAAGAELGPLTSLSESASMEGAPYGMGGMGGMSRAYARMVLGNPTFLGGEAALGAGDSREAIGSQPGEVSLAFVVSAAFALSGK